MADQTVEEIECSRRQEEIEFSRRQEKLNASVADGRQNLLVSMPVPAISLETLVSSFPDFW